MPNSTPPASTPKREADISVDVANIFLSCGLMVIRMNSGAAKSASQYIPFYRVLGIRDKRTGNERKIESGISDLLVLGNERAALVEVKRPGEDLRTSQKIFKAICDHFNVPYVTARSADDARAIAARYFDVPRGVTVDMPKIDIP